MSLFRKLKLIIKKQNCESNIRDLTKPMPPEGFCPLCGKKNDICKCEKLNCQCNIEAINCIWPECICSHCLEIDCECNKNEQ